MAHHETHINITLDYRAFEDAQTGKIVQRRLSQLKNYFSDQRAVEERLAISDPIIYDVWEVEYQGSGVGLSYGMTRIYSGKVGSEYFLTRGHFHENDLGDELYVVLSGQGQLVLFDHKGNCQVVEMLPGKMYYVPGHLAHRTVNSGSEDLIFFTVWPPNIVHDYGSIAETGFPRLVIATENGTEAVANPAFASQ